MKVKVTFEKVVPLNDIPVITGLPASCGSEGI
jgi:hypothetical protein